MPKIDRNQMGRALRLVWDIHDAYKERAEHPVGSDVGIADYLQACRRALTTVFFGTKDLLATIDEPPTDPLYRLVDLWRDGTLKQVILNDQRAACTTDGKPLEWPWSILVEGQEEDDLTYTAMNGKTPRHAARRMLRFATDPKYRKSIIEKHRREIAYPKPTRRTIRLEVPDADAD